MSDDPIALRAGLIARAVAFGEAWGQPADVRDFLDLLMARPSVDVPVLRDCYRLVSAATDAIMGSREHEYLTVPREALEEAALSMYHEAATLYATHVGSPMRVEVLV